MAQGLLFKLRKVRAGKSLKVTFTCLILGTRR